MASETQKADLPEPEGEVVRLLEALRRKCGLKRDALLERKILGVLRQQPVAERSRWAERMAVAQPHDAAWLAFVEAVTVHETYFFRDPAQLAVLAERILPELLARKAGGERHLRVWSAGCATGEEAYTVAMLVLDALAARGEAGAGWLVEILGSDISRPVLALARDGVYGAPGLDSFRRLPHRYERFFVDQPDGRRGRRRVAPEVARLVEFRQHNLMDETPAGTGFDIVLCRNVFIYFDEAAQRRTVDSLRRSLVDGGHLLLGVTDRLGHDSGFRRMACGGPVIYVRAEGA